MLRLRYNAMRRSFLFLHILKSMFIVSPSGVDSVTVPQASTLTTPIKPSTIWVVIYFKLESRSCKKTQQCNSNHHQRKRTHLVCSHRKWWKLSSPPRVRVRVPRPSETRPCVAKSRGCGNCDLPAMWWSSKSLTQTRSSSLAGASVRRRLWIAPAPYLPTMWHFL